ncbi:MULTISPECIES: hypothetical protein [Rhodomicrobium]|uniref:hypothetical protein n=1 Tax=Rhodomicrobium TaxID=1068 RepID=UPI000F7385E8|nr:MULTISPECIES: hypothetical protein [Rhodomicrobium]
MTGAAGILSSSAVPPAGPSIRAQAVQMDEPQKSELTELSAFSELINGFDTDEAPSAEPQPERHELEDEDMDGDDASAPLSAEITHQKWFTDDLDAPAAEAAPEPKPPRPPVRLADSQADPTSEAMQQALSSLVLTTAAYEWPHPSLPQLDDEIDLPEQPVAAAPQAAPPPRAETPAFLQKPPPPRQPLAPPPSPLTESDGAPPGIEASLFALESVLGGNSPTSSDERHRRSALVREADMATFRHEQQAPAHVRSPLGKIADRIVRELENLPAAPRRAG